MTNIMSEITLGVIRISSLSVCLYVFRMILLAVLASFGGYLLLKKLQSCCSKPAWKREGDLWARIRLVSIPWVQISGMVVVIILERVLNFLIPQQRGIVVDSLMDYREDTLPKELGKWFVYMWLASPFSLKPLKSFLEDKVMRHVEASLCVPAFKHIMELSADYHQDNSTVERTLTIRQYKNIPAVIRQCLVYALPSLFDTAGSIWYLAHFDSYIAIAALSVWAVLCWGNLKLMTLLPRRFACQNNAESKEVQLLSDVLLNWATVMHFGKLENEAKRYHRAVLERLNNERRRLNATHIISGIEFLHKDIILLPLAALVAQKVRNGTATPGDFTAFLTHWKRL